MPAKSVDLASIFQLITQNLAQNQQNLDQADTYNQDHGSNMVQTFQTITNALEKKQGSSASTALAYAGKVLANSATSGSGKLYAENLARAASQFKGKSVSEKGAMDLLQTLIGSGQGASAQPAAGGDLLGSLLGGLTGSGTNASGQQGGGLDLQDLLAAGSAFMQAKQQGQGNLGALVQAVAAGSGMGDSTHRNQSTQIVVQSFMQALSGMKK